MASMKNAFLDVSASEQSDNEQGYDSEAAEQAKGRRSTHNSKRPSKRRKVSPDAEEEQEDGDDIYTTDKLGSTVQTLYSLSSTTISNRTSPNEAATAISPASLPIENRLSKNKKEKEQKEKKKKKTPGVIYLSSLPPYLRPSALRNLLLQRGFSPITRLFLSPATLSHSRGSKSTKRQLYSEGWVEFASKTTARRCAETLNAAPVGGKKRGFYRDDVWNMKYLRGMAWEELMAGVREERREAEGRRDEERLVLARETKRFVQGVERGRKRKGIKEGRAAKRMRKNGEDGEVEDAVGVGEAPEIKRTWRQFEVRGKGPEESTDAGAGVREEQISEDVKIVLGKIF